MPQLTHTPEDLADRLAQLEEQTEHGQKSAADPTLITLRAELETVLTNLRASAGPNAFEQESACQRVTEMVQALGRPAPDDVGPADAQRNLEMTNDTLPRSSATAHEPLVQLGVYELLSKLGEGGMGAVYKARHAKLDKIVAIKVLPTERMKDTQAVTRFEREMRAVGKLEHPHIVRAMDAGEANGVHYLAMEYVQGVDLSQLIKSCHPLEIADACELIRQAALGLDEAHENGMVHRDIKPSNLMLCVVGKRKPPIVKILDMGLALLSEAHSPESQGLTTTGQMMGTLDYMAPEQGGDSKGVDIRADIYALGASLYKLLCGEAIYHGEKYQTPVQKMMALATQPAPPIQSRRTGIPAGLSDVLQRMLAKNPSERYATPAEVALALAPFCSGANLNALLNRAGVEVAVAKDAITQPSLAHPETNTSASVGEQTAPHAPVMKPTLAEARPQSFMLIGMICAGILAVAAAVVFFIPTPEGTLRVEVNDPSLEVTVKGTSVTFKKDGKDEYELAAGEKTLVVKHGEITFETSTKFELKKGAETVIKVELLPGEVRVVTREGTRLGSHKVGTSLETSPERRVAEWVIKSSGAVTLNVNGNRLRKANEWVVKNAGITDADSDLPAEPFQIIGIELWSPNPVKETELLDQLRGLRSLDVLRLYGSCSLTDDGLKSLSDLPALTGSLIELELDHTRLSNAGLAHLRKFTKLSNLGLRASELSVDGLNALRGLPLQQLTLGELKPLGAARLKALELFPDLKSLSLSISDLQDGDLVVFKNLTALQQLNITGPALTNASLAHLKAHKNLKSLGIDAVALSSDGVNQTLMGSSLEVIVVNGRQLDPLLPAAAEKPVALLRDSKPFRDFKQLAGAIAELQVGDVIELRGPGPFLLDVENGFAKPLHLRGAGSYRPRLNFVGGGRELKSSLKLEHCDLVQWVGDGGYFSSDIEVNNCRWQGSHIHLTGQPPKFTARDSIFILNSGWYSYNEGTELKLTNCLVRTNSPVFSLNNATQARFELRDSTFYNELQGGGPLLHGIDIARATVIAEGNAFHSRGQMEFLGIPNWRKTVDWQGKNNLYSGILFGIHNDKQEFVRHAKLDDWVKLWNKPEEGSKLVEQFEPLFVHTTLLPLPELRKVVEPVVASARERFQLPELGCNWDLVGPGEAYVRALEAAGRKPKELRPEVSAGGPFALLRAEKEFASYRSLEEAIKAAQDRDVIEIRTDETLPGGGISGEDARHLTLRAGAGYTPILKTFQSYTKDIWSFEGLTFDGQAVASLHDNDYFAPRGALHRVMNCTVLAAGSNQPWRMVPDGEQQPQILNTRVIRLHCTTLKDTAIKIENCVLFALVSGKGIKPTVDGSLELSRCAIWGPEPHFHWRDRLGGTLNSIDTGVQSKIVARDCYFAPGMSLIWHFDFADSKPPMSWIGTRNVFALPFGQFASGRADTNGLAAWTKFVQQEQGSFEDLPIHWEPRFWKLTPGTPGAGAGPQGVDLGADTTRVAVPSPSSP